MNTPSGVSTHIRTRRTWFISNSQAADCPGMDTTDMICSATCTKRKCTVAAPISRQVNTIKYNGKHVYTQRLRLSGRKQFSPSSLESVSGSGLRVKLLPQALAHRVAVCYVMLTPGTHPPGPSGKHSAALLPSPYSRVKFPPSYSLFYTEMCIYQGAALGTVPLQWLFLTHTEQRRQHSAHSPQRGPGPPDHQKCFALCPWQCSSPLLFERGSAAIPQV